MTSAAVQVPWAVAGAADVVVAVAVGTADGAVFPTSVRGIVARTVACCDCY